MSLIESFKSTLDEVREADVLVHVVDISHPNFEEHINVVNQTLAELKSNDKPTLMVFNKIDAYQFILKEEDDLTPATKENFSLDDLKKTWMSKVNSPVVFISALKKDNMSDLREALLKLVKQTHFIRYPNFPQENNFG